MYRLTFMTGARKGRRVAVQRGSLLIGRDHDVQLDLREDDEVSRHHALIEPQPDGYYLKDLGGMNPALVNGQAVRGTIKLKDNDQIEVGRTLMQFHLLEPQAVTGPRRSTSFLQWLTYVMMALFLAAQVAYWIIFPRFHQQPLPAPAPRVKQGKKAEPPPDAVKPSEPVRDRLQEELARVDQQAKVEEHAPILPLPPAPPATQAVAAVTGVATDAAPAEVAHLREAVADLRKQVQEIASSATNPSPAVAGPEPGPAASSNALLLAKAKDMLAAAIAQMQRGNLVEADAQLERVQGIAPDFIPAYVERARLYEQRGMLKKAGEQWTQVLNRAVGTPIYDQAAAERQRLARAEVTVTVARPDADSATPEQPALPRTIRIAAIEREKFEAGNDFDEMRVVRVQLRPKAGEGDIAVDEVQVVVTFYDRDERTDRVHVTRAVANKEPLKVDGLWRANEQKSITAAYMVAKNFRAEDAKKNGATSRYEGVRVRVYYRGRLQDEESVPRELSRLPPPPGPAAAAAPAARPSAPPPPARPAAVPPRAPGADDPNAPVSL